MENWGYEELELAEQFMILPATNEGLSDFIKNLEIESSSLTLTSKNRPAIPYSLQERPLYWIEREPPEDYLIAETLPSLKQYLGEDGYYWLSACAIFPELHWNLTLYLGNTLKSQQEKNKTLLQTRNLSNLSRLPWFRHGYIPDWLRLLLIADLSPEQDQNIRAKLNQLLVTAVTGSVSGIQLEIAEKHSNSVGKITKPLLKLFTDQSTEDSPLRDYIFQDFIAGNHEKLAVKLPQSWRKIITFKSKPGWKLWFQLILYQAFVSSIVWTIIFSLTTFYNQFNDDNALSSYIILILLLISTGFANSYVQLFLLNYCTFNFNIQLKIFWITSNTIRCNVSLFTLALLFNLDNLSGFSYLLYSLLPGIGIGIVAGLFRISFLSKINKRKNIGHLIFSHSLDATITLNLFNIFLGMIPNLLNLSYYNNFSVINLISWIIIGFIFGISSELFDSTALVWILRQPVQEQKEYKSHSSLSKWIIPIFFILTSIVGIFSQVLQNGIDEPGGEITRPSEVNPDAAK